MANCTHPLFDSTERPEAMRIVLVGKTGVGKSASGNTILGREAFDSDITPSSVTTQCKKQRGHVEGKPLYVIDTPGLFDTNHSKAEILTEIAKCICLSSLGPHAFLVTVQLGRFTKDEQETVKMIQQIFGDESVKFTIVLFTHGDRLRKKKSIDRFLSLSKELKQFTDQCHGQYHVFNNEDQENHLQVQELLRKIEKMVASNGGGYYTNSMYRWVEEEIEKEKERILKETEEKRNREKEELRKQLEDKMLKRALEDLEKRQLDQARWEAEHNNGFVCDCTGAGAAVGAAGGALVGLVGAVFGPLGILGGALIGAAGGAGVGLELESEWEEINAPYSERV